MNCHAAIGLLVVAVSAFAQSASPAKDAVHALQRSHPEIKWITDSVTLADVNCDGKPDTILLGSHRDLVAVGIVWGQGSEQTQVLTFALQTGSQDSFCARPTQIKISEQDCNTGEYSLPDCRPNPSCHDFSIIDHECDSFNFYWDSDHKRFAWW